MKILKSGARHTPKGEKVIFLAGPTKRRKKPSKKFTKWRRKAIKLLEKQGFNGVVVVPEPFLGDHAKQVAWEQLWLGRATKIVFWVARDYKNGAFATVTNLEFGQWVDKGPKKVAYGRPDKADSISTNDWHAKKNKIQIFDDLEALLIHAIA